MGEKKQELQVQENQTITPMQLLANAQAQGASIEQMQQFMDLVERHEEREARKAYNQALSDFRSEAPTIKRGRKGHNTTYAGLAETIEAIKDLLSKHGLSHGWRTSQEGGLITVECTVVHRLGHSESTSLTAEPDKTGSKNSIQAIGSTVAYLERYTLYAVLGLASREMDDDGGAADDGTVYISEKQEMDIIGLISEVGETEERFCTFYHIPFVAHLPQDQYEKAVKKLESKRVK